MPDELNQLNRDIGALMAEVAQMRAGFADLRTEMRELNHKLGKQSEEFQKITNRGYGVLIGVGMIGGGVGSVLPWKLSKFLGFG